jgi:hypothetical protein
MLGETGTSVQIFKPSEAGKTDIIGSYDSFMKPTTSSSAGFLQRGVSALTLYTYSK